MFFKFWKPLQIFFMLILKIKISKYNRISIFIYRLLFEPRSVGMKLALAVIS